MLATADAAGCIRAKGKRLVSRTILILATMVVMLVVAGGVAFAAVNYYYCPDAFTCRCPNPANGVVCVGTNDPNSQDNIVGHRNPYVGDKILARDGPDNVNGSEGNDRLDGGSGDDDYVFGSWGNDYLIGGDGIRDVCEGGSGYDRRGPGCEEFIQ
jgi:hemolysin type calcium-binding protein